MMTHETHMIGLHRPVREMIWPETMAIAAPTRENGSILLDS